jgi:hypothetical protein
METIATIATICAAWAGGIDYCTHTATQPMMRYQTSAAPSVVPTISNRFRLNDSHAGTRDFHAGQRVVQSPPAPRPR